jgi:hypothetical protein
MRGGQHLISKHDASLREVFLPLFLTSKIVSSYTSKSKTCKLKHKSKGGILARIQNTELKKIAIIRRLCALLIAIVLTHTLGYWPYHQRTAANGSK